MADNNTNMAASALEEEEKQQQDIESSRRESPTAANASSSGVGDGADAFKERPEQPREEPGTGSPARLESDNPPEIGGPTSSATISDEAATVRPTIGGPEVQGGLPEPTDNSGDKQSAKKGREEASGSGSGNLPKKARGELDAPKSEPTCAICGKQFATWKGVFGHLRAHPDRQWRGAFPPPIGRWSLDEFVPIIPNTAGDDQERTPLLEEQLAPALLSIARQTLEMMREVETGHTVVASSSAAGPSRRHHNIDLNVVPEDSTSSSSSSPPKIKEEKGFDLNLPPPENEDGSDASAQNL